MKEWSNAFTEPDHERRPRDRGLAPASEADVYKSNESNPSNCRAEPASHGVVSHAVIRQHVPSRHRVGRAVPRDNCPSGNAPSGNAPSGDVVSSRAVDARVMNETSAVAAHELAIGGWLPQVGALASSQSAQRCRWESLAWREHATETHVACRPARARRVGNLGALERELTPLASGAEPLLGAFTTRGRRQLAGAACDAGVPVRCGAQPCRIRHRVGANGLGVRVVNVRTAEGAGSGVAPHGGEANVDS